MDLLIKIRSYCLLEDIRKVEQGKHIFLGTFENYEWYGWFVEGKNKELLISLLWETKNGSGGKSAFPYVPLSRKKIPSSVVNYEVWFPILKKGEGDKPDKHLGWSRTSDLSFDLTFEEIETLTVGPHSIFTVLCYEAEDEYAPKWLRAKKVKEKKNA